MKLPEMLGFVHNVHTDHSRAQLPLLIKTRPPVPSLLTIYSLTKTENIV